MAEPELTEEGGGILGGTVGLFVCKDANWPIVEADAMPDLPAFEAFLYFRTEVSSNGVPVGVMVNSPANFRSQFKQGRVICVSPHPEQTAGLEDIVP